MGKRGAIQNRRSKAGTKHPDKNVPICSVEDIVEARKHGRALAVEIGFAGPDLTLVATAISEVARNIVDHAKRGEIRLAPAHQGRKRGILIVASDHGPGIPEINLAMQYGYSTNHGLGVGLPGARWLMDDFEIDSTTGKGTTVTMKKWLPQNQSR